MLFLTWLVALQTLPQIGGYHSSNPQCQLEPLGEHLRDYEHALASNIGLGVGACWRGGRLYDPAVPATKLLVQKWVKFYKKYLRIVTSDLVHVRAPDGQSVDCMLHVNPALPRHKVRKTSGPTSGPSWPRSWANFSLL
jgi:hypothetical protein